MVGVGFKGKKSILARVSICNLFGKCVYDKFVMPNTGETVVDYRTEVSGIRPQDLLESNGALPFEIVTHEVKQIFKNRILVGHQLNSDLKVLKIKHPGINIRDTAKYFTKNYGNTPSLKRLVKDFLEIGFQTGEHSSVQDAQATMKIYTMHKKQWEKDIWSLKVKYEEENGKKVSSQSQGSSQSQSTSNMFSMEEIQTNKTGNEEVKKENQSSNYHQNKSSVLKEYSPKKHLRPNESAITNVVYKNKSKSSKSPRKSVKKQ